MGLTNSLRVGLPGTGYTKKVIQTTLNYFFLICSPSLEDRDMSCRCLYKMK